MDLRTDPSLCEESMHWVTFANKSLTKGNYSWEIVIQEISDKENILIGVASKEMDKKIDPLE